ncbi:MAG TPA: serine hydrolase [Caulobacteraceae bacterium]|nr:serine hydrolase [Caulobacteraceae bacterium]
MAGWLTHNPALFRGGPQVENFRSMSTIYPVRVIRRAPKPSPLPAGEPFQAPERFSYEGRTLDTAQFLAEMETTGLIAIRDGRVVFEDYWLGNDASCQTIGWSVTKSFVSALVGIAIGEGAIGSVEDPVTRYAPSLAGSGYDGVRLKDVLQMSSGVRWNEDYSDPNSDVGALGREMVSGGSLDAFAARCVRGCAPGTFNRYNSIDTHVLGMVVRGATGQTLSDYLHDKLWAPLGMEADGFMVVDATGAEMAMGGLNAVLRDYARLGCCYLNGGAWNGAQVVPASWVRASVTPDAPHLRPGPRPNAALPMGYGYQWWVPDDSGAFCAIGVYNQFVWVDPATRTVVAKSSAFHRYGSSPAIEDYRVGDHFAFFAAIADAIRADS